MNYAVLARRLFLAGVLCSGFLWLPSRLNRLDSFWILFPSITVAFALLMLADLGSNEARIRRSIKKIPGRVWPGVGLPCALVLWATTALLSNDTGRKTILYAGKLGFVQLFFFLLPVLYFMSLGNSRRNYFLRGFYWVLIGMSGMHALVGLYQFTFNAERIFGIDITPWYHPTHVTSFFGNPNQMGLMQFFGILAGLNLLFFFSRRRRSLTAAALIALLVLQSVALLLSISRSAYGITAAYSFLFLFANRSRLRSLKNIAPRHFVLPAMVVLICAGILARSSDNEDVQRLQQGKWKTGLNKRDVIWKEILIAYPEYLWTGDGLRFTILDRVQDKIPRDPLIAGVFTEEDIVDKQAGRMNYHNTVVRYFALTGPPGAILFLSFYFFLAWSALREYFTPGFGSGFFPFLAVFFVYMQVEEVMPGEIVPGALFLVIMTALTLGGRNKQRGLPAFLKTGERMS